MFLFLQFTYYLPYNNFLKNAILHLMLSICENLNLCVDWFPEMFTNSYSLFNVYFLPTIVTILTHISLLLVREISVAFLERRVHHNNLLRFSLHFQIPPSQWELALIHIVTRMIPKKHFNAIANWKLSQPFKNNF